MKSSQITSFTTLLDIFSIRPKFFINNKTSYQTIYGGLTSLLFGLLILAYFISIMIEISNRNLNNLVTNLNIYNETAKVTPLKYGSDLTIMISLVDKNFTPVDITYFELFKFSAFSSYWEQNSSGPALYVSNSIEVYTTKCNSTNLSDFNIKYQTLLKDKIYCLLLDPVLDTDGSFSIGGSLLTESGQYSPGISVRPNDNYLVNSTMLDKWNNYVQSNLGGFLVFFSYQGTNLSDPNYSLSKFLIWNTVLFQDINSSNNLEINLQNISITKDLSLFPGNSNTFGSLTLNNIITSTRPNKNFELILNIQLSNIISQLKISAPKYDYYFNKMIVISCSLYSVLGFIIRSFFNDSYLHYLLSKFVKVSTLEKSLSGFTQLDEDIKRVIQPKSTNRNLKKNQTQRDFNYETTDIELKNLKFIQEEDLIEENRNLSEIDRRKLEELDDKSENKEIVIELKDEVSGGQSDSETERKQDVVLRKSLNKRVFNMEILYEKHQQEYRIMPSSYFDYFIHIKKKIKGEKLIQYFNLKFCCFRREKIRMKMELYKFYENSMKNLLSYENLIQNLTEFSKLKKILFNESQNLVFSSFYANCYLPNEINAIQPILKDDSKEVLNTLTSPVFEYFEHIKNRMLLEQMNLELISCTKVIEKE